MSTQGALRAQEGALRGQRYKSVRILSSMLLGHEPNPSRYFELVMEPCSNLTPHKLRSFGPNFLGVACIWGDVTPLKQDPDRVRPIKLPDLSTKNGIIRYRISTVVDLVSNKLQLRTLREHSIWTTQDTPTPTFRHNISMLKYSISTI